MYDTNHLAQAIRAASVGRDGATFLKVHDTGATVSYGAFFGNAERIASALARAGLKPGDRVAVQAPKTVAMLELYVGTVLAGGVFLPLNTAYTPAEVAYFLGDATPRIFVCEPSKLSGLTPVAEQAGVAEIWTLAPDESGTLAEHRDAEAAGFTPVPRREEDLAAILYTSGTTGRSKGAMLTHRALESNSRTLQEYWRFTEADVLIHALPIFHTHGLFVATNTLLLAGGAMILLPRLDIDALIRWLPRATSMMGVPTFYTRLLDDPRFTRDLVAHMRLFISGSAPLLAETHTAFEDRTGHRILERYGMTETNMNTSNPCAGERRAGTVGLPLPGVALKVTDPESGADLPQGEIGILEVRGPNVFQGYWQMPEKTAAELRPDGFFITGDLGRIDADGYVTIVGRKKDLIIAGGYNIYPKEIELELDEAPGVRESAVIGVPHADLGEAVLGVLVALPGATPDTAAILADLGRRLARFKVPRALVVVHDLPRNTMGKVQKNLLRARFKDWFAA